MMALVYVSIFYMSSAQLVRLPSLLAIQIRAVVKIVWRIPVGDMSSHGWVASVHLIMFRCWNHSWIAIMIVIIGRSRSHGGVALILLVRSRGRIRIALADGGRNMLCRALSLGILVMAISSRRRPQISFILKVGPWLRGAIMFLFSRGRAGARTVARI
jgi:hypothetical protein